jgi:hypothetical protein
MMKNKIIILGMVVCAGLSAFSQDYQMIAKQRKCYQRDQRIYIEDLALNADSTFGWFASLGDEVLVTGRWRQHGDTVFMEYNKPHIDPIPKIYSRLHKYDAYVIRENFLCPLVTVKGKTRRTKSDAFRLVSCGSFLLQQLSQSKEQ